MAKAGAKRSADSYSRADHAAHRAAATGVGLRATRSSVARARKCRRREMAMVPNAGAAPESSKIEWREAAH